MMGPIKTVGVYVEDQAKAKSFYLDTLGFTLRREMPMGPDATWLEVSPPGAESALVIYPKSMMQDWQEQKLTIVSYCADVDATIEELRHKGVSIGMEPSDMPWGKFATFADPDDNEFGLTEQELA